MTRFSLFVVLSLLVHWLVLQLDMTSTPHSVGVHRVAVGYLQRSAAEFLADAQGAPAVEDGAAGEKTVSPVAAPAPPQQKRLPATPAAARTDDATPSKPEPSPVQPPVKPAPKVVEQTVGKVAAQPRKMPMQDVVQIQPAQLRHSAVVVEDDQLWRPAAESSAAAALHEQTGEVQRGAVADEVGQGTDAEPTLPGSAADFQQALARYDLNPLPVYPEVARRRGWEGTVKIEVQVGADGHVVATALHASSGRRSLDLAALRAVRRWQFKPAQRLGVAVESRLVVPIDFVLDE